ncbi:MAG: hypothetical protein HYZ16_09035, partial [Bacteroidetes bacterium]|nr:hypothetical protein [Bacteroidota bacterium]
HHAGTDPEERKLIEDEQEAWRTFTAMFEEQAHELIDALKKKDKILKENEISIKEKDLALERMARELEEMRRKLEGK